MKYHQRCMWLAGFVGCMMGCRPMLSQHVGSVEDCWNVLFQTMRQLVEMGNVTC